MKTAHIGGLITAAGMSTRMNGFKPLLRLGEKTMIETVTDRMLEGGAHFVVIVVGYRAGDVKAALSENAKRMESIRFVYNEKYAETSMLDSIRIGVSHMPPCDAFFLTPADMPAISAGTYRRLIREADGQSCRVLFPVVDGYRKHPPLISGDMIGEIRRFRGAGLRELWRLHESELGYVDILDRGCEMDVDDRSDYAAVREYLS